MKAKEINGEIKIFTSLPSYWNGNKHWVSGFENATKEELESEGFYDIDILEYNSEYESVKYSFDKNLNKFVGEIISVEIVQSLKQLKELKLNQLKFNTTNKLKETDWYIIRSIERNVDIPQTITDERNLILSDFNTKESENQCS
jgi:hypothetical protein